MMTWKKNRTAKIKRKIESGFSILELIISMSVSSILFATILFGYEIAMETFDSQLDDTRLWSDLREATSSISRDLRDATSIDTSSITLLVSFTKNQDGVTYSYYIDAKKSLVRQVGTSSLDGRTIAKNMDEENTTITVNGNLVTINLVANKSDYVARLYTSVKSRNM